MNEASTRGQFARYVIAGAVNTAVTYVLLVTLMRVIEYRLAYSIAYLAGVVLGCWLQCRFVFHVPLDWRNAIRFPAVYAIQYLTGLLLLWALVDAASMRREWAALLVVVLNVPIGFVTLRFLLRTRARSSARDGAADRYMAAAPPPAVKDGTLEASMSKLSRMGDAMIEHPAITLFAIWLLQMAYLGALQLAGLPFGFAVWPMGEDRNWLRFMQDGSGLSMMHQFWTMNDRNPLSPWWYWLFRWPIYHSDYGLYLIRKLVDPFLAIAVALLLGRLFRYRSGPLPLLGGLLILTCNFSVYREQIVWNFLLALGIALTAVYAYLRHVDGKRGLLPELGISLWLFLLAIATYTLDIGIVAAIAAIALVRVPRESTHPAVGLRDRVIELGSFAAMAMMFVAIWYTMSRASSSYYTLDLALLPANALSSIRQFLWHPDFSYWIQLAATDRLALVAGAGMLVVVAIPAWIVLTKTNRAWRVEPAMLGWTVVLLVAIGAPIVALESTSGTWLPGYRSRMIYQVSAPLIAVLVIGATCVAARRRRSARSPTLIAGVGFLAALAFVIPASIEYNRQLVERTAVQRAFAHEFVRLADDRDDIRSFLIRYVGGAASQWGSDALSDTYAKTMTRRNDVSMRLIPDHPVSKDSPWRAWWRIVLRPDDEGVRNYAPASAGSLPYQSVLFVDWDGGHLSVPSNVDREWFDGLQVDWERERPIIQSPRLAPTCPSRFDFSTAPLRGRGWSVPEPLSGGRHAIWMNSEHASLEIRTQCSGAVELRLAVAGYMADDILAGLRLRVDGIAVPVAVEKADDGNLNLRARAVIDAAARRMTIDLDAPRTLVPPNGNRTLAVMFSSLIVDEVRRQVGGGAS